MKNFRDIWWLSHRPKTVEDMVLEPTIKKKFLEMTKLDGHILFLGRAGSGKTTLAKILADKFAPDSTLFINASDKSGVDFVRNDIQKFIQTKTFSLTEDGKKIVILDEADGLSSNSGTGSNAQDALRSIMETYAHNAIFILTANHPEKITEQLNSRCKTYTLSSPLDGVVARVKEVLKLENVTVPKDQVPKIKRIIEKEYPDIRKILNEIQGYCDSETNTITIPDEIEDKTDFVLDVLKLVKKHNTVFPVREFIIKNEPVFESDYQILLKKFFNYYVSKQDTNRTLLTVGYMSEHDKVTDKEVNFAGYLISLGKTYEKNDDGG